MDDEQSLNSYQNASTPLDPDVPADLAGFMLAADPVLAQAAELARVLARAHQGAATQLIGEGWAYARKYFSLSEKYGAWADYHTPAPAQGGGADRVGTRRRIRGCSASPAATCWARCSSAPRCGPACWTPPSRPPR
jgi:hypothetical protein